MIACAGLLCASLALAQVTATMVRWDSNAVWFRVTADPGQYRLVLTAGSFPMAEMSIGFPASEGEQTVEIPVAWNARALSSFRRNGPPVDAELEVWEMGVRVHVIHPIQASYLPPTADPERIAQSLGPLPTPWRTLGRVSLGAVGRDGLALAWGGLHLISPRESGCRLPSDEEYETWAWHTVAKLPSGNERRAIEAFLRSVPVETWGPVARNLRMLHRKWTGECP